MALNGEKLYKELSIDDIDESHYDIEIDKFKSTFDTRNIAFINENDISEKPSRKSSKIRITEINNIDETIARNSLGRQSKSSVIPAFSRLNSLLSTSFTDDFLNNTEELYDLAEQYGIPIETINQCGTNLTPKQFIGFRAVFDYLDLDKSGDISIDEFMQVFGRMSNGDEWTKQDIQEFLKKVDTDNNGELDFSEFLIMMSGSLSLQFNKRNMLKAFPTFAEEAPNLHLIDIDKLRNNLKQLYCIIDPEILKSNTDGSNISKHEIDSLLRLLPVSDDGYFNVKTFLDSIM